MRKLARKTITFSDFTNIVLSKLLLVTKLEIKVFV